VCIRVNREEGGYKRAGGGGELSVIKGVEEGRVRVVYK
jgi:hypothetical protein